MNRVPHHIIQQGTSIPYSKCKVLETPLPSQTGFRSQKFPIYPITLSMLLDNPPFNKISLAFQSGFVPQTISIFGSQNGLQYVEIKTLTDLEQKWEEIIQIFEKKLIYSYIKLVFRKPKDSNHNICNQIKIRGIQYSMVTFFQTNFVCSLKSKLCYHPILFRLLQILQYKSIILKKDGNKLYQKYEKRLQQLTKKLPKIKYQMITPQQISKWQAQITYLQSQPIIMDSFISYPDPVKAKKDVFKLQKQLQTFGIDRQMTIKPDVKHYFQKYQNKTIRENYLQELSSNKVEQHSKALVNFWNQLKVAEPFTHEIQEAALVFLNFYLQFLDFPRKVNALKTLILLNKLKPMPKAQSLEKFYIRILSNLIKFIHLKEDQDLYNLSIKYTYTIYQKINNEAFIGQLLNAHKSYSLPQRIQKIQILQKITFRGVQINNRKEIVQFLIDFLLEKEISLTDKNRAYNIAAYLASIYGKQNVLKDFQKLNSMILMTMERSIDGKLGKITSPHHNGGQQNPISCQFCGFSNPNFKDDNLYDLHLAKQCKFITTCAYCSQNVEIPELFKHYIEQCTSKHEFKHCDNCFEVILAKDEQAHNKGCRRKLETKCPLCYEKVESKLKLKEHLLGKGCPNNPR